ncbi:DUF3043 domain-containing protein [Tomitella biformata]|uniref:DUF3043 domain-containing protein n=1 Tax=Tomitella biformata TaxID=630403 RepID=UPI0004638164|nr:DUF3043 domain-containing protein [Tomitella biformata]
MKLRRGGSEKPSKPSVDDVVDTDIDDASADDESTARVAKGTTEKKGRPTPRRREAERKRGPAGPAPLNSKEARARRKVNKDGTKKSRAERKAEAAGRRSTMSERRELMMDGDERYLHARDKGPERKFVRDYVDSSRHLLGLFMPLAIVMIISLFLNPAIQSLVALFMLVMVAIMLIEGFFLARRIYNMALERFPNLNDSKFSLGWYAFVRASQLRKMRTPRPQVSVGAEV